MSKKPRLISVTSTLSLNDPPRTLREHGRSLWDNVMSEYHVECQCSLAEAATSWGLSGL